jgi:hypothetical protein
MAARRMGGRGGGADVRDTSDKENGDARFTVS